MPELPEVETIRLGLQNKIVGLKIKNIQILNPKTFSGNPKSVEGYKITSVWRRAKVLGITVIVASYKTRSVIVGQDTIHRRVIASHSEAISKNTEIAASQVSRNDENLTILIHLKMSGQLILIQSQGKRLIGGHPTQDMHGELPNKSTRVIFELENPRLKPPLASLTESGTQATRLYFNDQRKFGWIRVSDKQQVTSDKFLKSLGPEPLEKEFIWQQLKQNLLKHKSQPVKVAILNQSVVSGVGNIYACEACFNAKLDPRLKVSDLTNAQFKNLHQGLIKALKSGIKHGGSSKTHFVNEEGKKGFFLDHAFVYGRERYPCKICKTKIQKIKLGGRGTYFCPTCQVAST